jgi:NAD+ synthase (glutamine-hydrolysing)
MSAASLKWLKFDNRPVKKYIPAMLKVSLAQINPKSGDIRGNASKIILGIERAREEKCDLVVFPEMCLPGYCLDEKLLINLRFLRENKRVLMEEIRPACQGVAAVVGFIDFDESRKGPDSRVARHNAAAVIQDGELLQVVHKRLLPGYRYFEDKRYFQPGREVEPVTIRAQGQETKMGVLICEDLWDEDYEFKPSAILREKGAEAFVCINASPFVGSTPGERDGKRFRRDRLIRSQIERYGVPIIYVNTVGIGDNGKNIIPYDGRSIVYSGSGQLLAVLEQFREDQRSICLGDDRAASPDEAPYDREEEIFDALVMSIRDYYDKLGIFKCVLEAVSGGIDSSLGTAIAFDAVGRDLLSVYNLPSRYNSPITQELARQLAENFGLGYHVIPIQEMVDQVVRDFERYLRPIRLTVTVENLQSRIRGLIMMAESNDREALLLTNGNETEIALGYATLYGDMVGGLSVIGDLTKPDVYRLARYVNRKWGREMIPETVFSIAPSAELKADQVDPFDYPVVGPVVNDIVEMGLCPEELVERFASRSLPEKRYPVADEAIYERYTTEQFRDLTRDLYRVINQSVYKRLQGAPIVVVSDRAFGFDLRETIINGWAGG